MRAGPMLAAEHAAHPAEPDETDMLFAIASCAEMLLQQPSFTTPSGDVPMPPTNIVPFQLLCSHPLIFAITRDPADVYHALQVSSNVTLEVDTLDGATWVGMVEPGIHPTHSTLITEVDAKEPTEVMERIATATGQHPLGADRCKTQRTANPVWMVFFSCGAACTAAMETIHAAVAAGDRMFGLCKPKQTGGGGARRIEAAYPYVGRRPSCDHPAAGIPLRQVSAGPAPNVVVAPPAYAAAIASGYTPHEPRRSGPGPTATDQFWDQQREAGHSNNAPEKEDNRPSGGGSNRCRRRKPRDGVSRRSKSRRRNEHDVDATATSANTRGEYFASSGTSQTTPQQPDGAEAEDVVPPPPRKETAHNMSSFADIVRMLRTDPASVGHAADALA